MPEKKRTTKSEPTRARTYKTLTRQERWDRDLQCVQLRRAQVDWDTIVERCGYASRGHAHDRWVAFMKEYPRADVEEARQVEEDRLDQAGRALWPKVLKGDPRAIEVFVKLSERRSKMLRLDRDTDTEDKSGLVAAMSTIDKIMAAVRGVAPADAGADR